VDPRVVLNTKAKRKALLCVPGIEPHHPVIQFVVIIIIKIILIIIIMWNVKCFIIPAIIGATGIVSKSLQKYLETIPGQHPIDSLQ
jgi:hypothetical protein